MKNHLKCKECGGYISERFSHRRIFCTQECGGKWRREHPQSVRTLDTIRGKDYHRERKK